ncbi:regucalcin like protein [Xylariales sp. PMI_506]|nr:regucalcin like protein [Xylariales sp. PMI_506]
MKQWVVDAPFLPVQGLLLEGPYYDEARNECRFIDIPGNKLHTFNPDDPQGSLRTIDTEDALGVTANIKGTSKHLIVGARSGFATIDTTTGRLNYLARTYTEEVDGAERVRIMRCNDGAVDSHGRYWVGSMTDSSIVGEERAEGILFRLDPDLSLHRILDGVTSPNGTGWNAADTIMYWTDSTGPRSIYAFDFDAPSGALTNRREFWNAKTAGYADGVNPDGLIVDAEDCVWTALWRGFKVVRLNPDGQAIGEVCLPTSYVTCPVFVGTELVITTARDPTVEEEGIKRGGDVYRVDVGVRGAPRFEFTLPDAASISD